MRSRGSHRILLYLFILALLLILVGCNKNDQEELLNPEKPIEIRIWHYYSGSILNSFEDLVREFNETIGKDKGLLVKSQSYGDVSDLANALYASAGKEIGSLPPPDIFAAYPDNVLKISGLIDLVDLNDYFSQEEVEEFREEFIEEGYLLGGDSLYILPIAKATENLFVNKTDWERFAKNYGYSDGDLETWQGIYRVAETYYEDRGKSFFNLDSLANFIFVFARQNEIEIISPDKNARGSFTFPLDLAERIWDYLYKPYIKGYYGASGRFSTDDIKTGDIIAFVGSTSGAGYYPKSLAGEDGSYEKIEPLVLAYPHMGEGSRFAINQGAGMCITRSDKAREYGASIFLKWFTDIEQNLRFAVESGYLPVKKRAYEEDLILKELNRLEGQNKAIRESMKISISMLDDYSLYSNKPYDWTYDIRTYLEDNLREKIKDDTGNLLARMKAGESRDAIISEMTSEDRFIEWYEEILAEIERIRSH